MKRETEPTEKWSLARLGQYCRAKTDRMAVDAWLAGKAMALAKRKAKHGEYSSWKRKWRYSDATVSRYIRLFEAHESVESLRGKEIMEALREAEIVAAKPPEPNPQVARPARAVAKKMEKEPPSTPAKCTWAMSTPADLRQCDEFVDIKPETELTSEGIVILEIKRLTSAFVELKRQLEWIARQDKELLDRAWSHEYNIGLKAEAKELQEILKTLVELIPA